MNVCLVTAARVGAAGRELTAGERQVGHQGWEVNEARSWPRGTSENNRSQSFVGNQL